MRKWLIILLVLAMPLMAIAGGVLVRYPIYLVAQEGIVVVCPTCKAKGLKSKIFPGNCLYDNGQYIDEEGVIHLKISGTITCSHTCSNGHTFMWTF